VIILPYNYSAEKEIDAHTLDANFIENYGLTSVGSSSVGFIQPYRHPPVIEQPTLLFFQQLFRDLDISITIRDCNIMDYCFVSFTM